MLPIEVHDRTFHIAYREGEGTAFAIDVNDQQYLITAKHVVAGLEGDDEIEIVHGGSWKRVGVRSIGQTDLDVAVLAPAQQLAHKNMILECGDTSFFVG